MDHLPKNVRTIFNKLGRNATQAQQKLLKELDLALTGMVPATGGGVIELQSMVASKTKQPMVVMTWGTNKGELTPIEARRHALFIIQCAEAAVQDAAVFDFMMSTSADSKPEDGYRMITAIRDHRAKFESDEL